ncbi:MAG: ParB/RepB/Spo0J family partition protein [Gammaproteobacteria bacterium]
MSENKSLNRGLDALLGDQKIPTTTKEIDLEKITAGRYQPRQVFDSVKIQELAESIKKHGVLSPILVREVGLDKFEVIAGERRVRASKIAGLKTIPSLVNQKEDQEALEAALIENLQREDLNPVEEARGYDRLKREFELTQDEIAKATGKARSTIANSMRILSLSPKILDMISQGALEKGHAKILSGLDTTKAEQLAEAISQKKLTVRQAEALLKPAKKTSKIKAKDRDTLNIEDEISGNFGHKTEIDTKTSKTGKVSIFYHSPDELETIIQKLLKL